MASVDQLEGDNSLSAIASLPQLKVTVAPNWARRSHAGLPQFPITAAQIVETAKVYFVAGAHDIHLHIRVENGAHSLDPITYRKAMSAIRQSAPEMGTHITTGSGSTFDVETQPQTLEDLRPAAASVSAREVLRGPELTKLLNHSATDAGTALQHTLDDFNDLENLRRLLDAKIVPETQTDVILEFGRYNPPRCAAPKDPPAFVHTLARKLPNWTFCASGKTESPVAEEAVRRGGSIHVGFENNIPRPDGSLATNNAKNFGRAMQMARHLDRQLLPIAVI